MATFEAQDLDSSTEGAWRSFVVQVADRLTSSEQAAEIVLSPVHSPAGSLPPRMRLGVTARETVTVGTTALSDPVSPWRFDAESGTNLADGPLSSAYRLASLAAAELRETWGVVHPSFLVGLDGTSAHTATSEDVDPSSAIAVDTEEELERAVQESLRYAVGPEIHKSSDGSFAVPLGSITAYVYISDITEVRVHAPIVERISGRTRAAELVADLNRRHPRLKFLLVDDRIHVTAGIDAFPFVPMHLLAALRRLSEFAVRVDDAFAEHLGGVPSVDSADRPLPERPTEDAHEDETTDLPPRLMTLLELDSVADGAVDVEVVVSVCSGDRSTIIEYEQFCSEQSRSWRESSCEARESGDLDEAAECEAEAVPWDRMVSTLRLALRTVSFYDNA